MSPHSDELGESKKRRYFPNNMRECLGWVTTCTDERRCPMNWLELPASDAPSVVRCHVCGSEVELPQTEQRFREAQAEQKVAAFPVVPVAGRPASYASFRPRDVGAEVRSARANEIERAPDKPRAEPVRKLYCILSNGEAIAIEKETALIGRSRTCDVPINSPKVSRHHAAVIREGDKYLIEDLGSANGVWRRGEKLSGRTPLAHGDVIQLSEEHITFEFR